MILEKHNELWNMYIYQSYIREYFQKIEKLFENYLFKDMITYICKLFVEIQKLEFITSTTSTHFDEDNRKFLESLTGVGVPENIDRTSQITLDVWYSKRHNNIYSKYHFINCILDQLQNINNKLRGKYLWRN